MTKTRSTKSALISSVIALLLCFAMLVGSTFAWFTDSVTSANNIIKSGNLDIALDYWDGENNEWKTVEGTDSLFTNNLWEPGHTEVVYLKLSNLGTLALKYQLAISVLSETEGTNVADEAFKLSDYIRMGVKEDVNGEIAPYADRAVAVEAVKDASGIIGNGYAKQGEMLAGADELYMAVVVYMPETVGNIANAKAGTPAPTINLGVNVLATQLAAEGDSFDNKYDEPAPLVNVIVSSEEELVAALAEAKNGDVIGIKGNVTWTTGASIGSTPFVENASTYVLRPAENPLTYVTLQGVGDDATFTAIGSGVGAIGIDNGTVIFKDLKIVDESVSYAENSWEYGYLEFRGNTVFENCDVVNALMMEGESAKFVNCTLNSNDDNQYAVWVSDGNASFESCTITGARGIKIHEAYGSLVDTVIINNNKFLDLTKKPGIAIGDVDPDTTIVVQNNTFAGTQAGDQGNYKYESDTDVTTFDFVDADNTVAGYADTNEELKGQLQNNATVVLPEGEYTLPTMSGKEGITIIGAADGSTVVGGENTSTGFGSNFGKDTTIQNVTFTGSSNGVRWSYAQGGTSTFDNCTFAGDSTYGFHIDSSNGATFIFNNCTFSGFNAFAGDLEKVVFNNCTFLNNGNYGHTNIWSVGEFNNCTWGDKTSVSPAGSGKLYFNGVEESYHHEFIGSAESLFAFAKTVNEDGDDWKDQKVLLVADIDLENAAWTPIGQTGATEFKGIFDGQGHTIKNLNVDNSAATDAHTSSGLFGWAESNVTIKNIKVDGATIVGNHNVAVIVGYTYSGKISNCHVTNANIVCNHANKDACGDKCGLIAGYAADESRITDCSASISTVKAGRDAGQLVGCGYNVSVSGCSATDVTVTATGDCNDEKNINNAVIGRVIS